ncbi:mannose-6-phosphate isomerase, type I [Actinidia rufa]|uniref:Mannose-6-phosphate isomerase, type I n=1 Tax=Actinidia rufa TaxID=165716 RepID=A0A7J0FZS4_9ERIC|nr:mannose-6-phosphate isomerase, type I [Actinidia rufa]
MAIDPPPPATPVPLISSGEDLTNHPTSPSSLSLPPSPLANEFHSICKNYNGLDVEESRLYTEFWLYTHESGTSFLVEALENGVSMAELSESLSLKSWIDEHPSVPGDKVVEKWGVNLPFVIKELKDVLQNVPKIAEVVGHSAYANQVLDINYQDGEEKLKAFIQSIFTQLMYASKDVSSMLTYKQGFPEILQESL